MYRRLSLRHACARHVASTRYTATLAQSGGFTHTGAQFAGDLAIAVAVPFFLAFSTAKAVASADPWVVAGSSAAGGAGASPGPGHGNLAFAAS